MFNVYTRNNVAKIIPDDKISFNIEQALVSRGWQHVWDSAPSVEKAKEYASEHYRAWTKEEAPNGVCRLCGFVPAMGLVTGMRCVPEIYPRPIPYKGFVCEQCAGELETVKWVK